MKRLFAVLFLANALPLCADEPFSFADFTWLNGNSRQHTPVFDFKAFTGEVRVDTNYVYDFNHPRDHTLVGSSELGRRPTSPQIPAIHFAAGTHRRRLITCRTTTSLFVTSPIIEHRVFRTGPAREE